MPLIFPPVNFIVVPNNIDFASVIDIFEEEHESEDSDPKPELGEELYFSNIDFKHDLSSSKLSKYFYKSKYRCQYTPKLHLPPPDLALLI